MQLCRGSSVARASSGGIGVRTVRSIWAVEAAAIALARPEYVNRLSSNLFGPGSLVPQSPRFNYRIGARS